MPALPTVVGTHLSRDASRPAFRRRAGTEACPTEVFPPSVNADGLEPVLADRGEGDVAIGHQRHLGAVGRMHGIGGLVIDDDLLDEGQVLDAQGRQVALRQVTKIRTGIHDLRPFCPLPSPRMRAIGVRT